MRLIQCVTLLVHLFSATGEGLRVADIERRSEESVESSLTLSKAKYAFGETIDISFTNPSPSRADAYPYFAVFKDEDGNAPLDAVPDWDFFIAWLNDCNSQNDCINSPTEGTVEFSAGDPKEAYYYEYYDYEYGYGYFPFRNGKYVVCFLLDIYDPNAADDGAVAIDQQLITDCARFHVRKPVKKMLKKAKVIPKPRKIKFKDNFVAKFKSPVPVPNQWIGVYKAENNKAPKVLDDKDLLWGYTSCETQQGDQTETTNCNRKWKKGKVTLTESHLNLENPDASWPLPKGSYFMCMNFHANKPYDQFKCSKKIIVS